MKPDLFFPESWTQACSNEVTKMHCNQAMCISKHISLHQDVFLKSRNDANTPLQSPSYHILLSFPLLFKHLLGLMHILKPCGKQ